LHFSQCTSFSRRTGDCDTSKFHISDFTFSDVKGTARTDFVANLQCSAAAPCERLRIEGIDVRVVDGHVEGGIERKKADKVGCRNVKTTQGFKCTNDIGKNGNGS
jgi:galacturan 1,4-alpha-galacturonidase